MNIDPNVYGLSIELSLSTGKAFESLNRFEAAVTGIETQVTAVAQKALGEIESLTDKLEKNISSVSASLKDVSVEGDKFSQNISQAQADTATMGGNIDSQIDDITKSIKLWDEILEIHEEIVKLGQDELDRVGDYVRIIEDIKQAIDLKNKSHATELEYIRQETKAFGNVAQQATNFNDSLAGNATIMGGIVNLAKHLFILVAEIDQATENFVATNYRAYGTQQQLVQQARLLTAEYGLLDEQAIEATKALASLRIPEDELKQYVVLVSEASRYTGASVEVLAAYAHSLRQVGMDAVATQRHLQHMAASMRMFGLSTADLNRILGNTTISIAEIDTVFGPGAVEQLNLMRTNMAGLSKQLGFSADASEKFIMHLMDPSNRILLERFSGESIDNISDLTRAMITSGEKIQEQIQNMRDSGMDDVQIQYQLQALSEAYGFANVESMHLAARLAELSNEMGLNLDNAEDMQKAYETLYNESLNPVSDANATLAAQFRILTTRIRDLAHYALQPLADGLAAVLIPINMLLGAMTKIARVVGDVWGWFEKLWIIGPIFKAIRIGAGFVAVLTGGFLLLAGSLMFAERLAMQLGRAMEILFQTLGDGLQRLGQSVSKVVVPLMGLGAAFLMMGAGAYLFAEGVQTIASAGWAAIPALIGLSAVVLGFAQVLVALGALAQGPVALGILAIGAGFLAIGAAAWLMGAGIQMAAGAFQTMVEVMKEVSAELLVNFANALIASSMRLAAAGAALLPAAATLIPGSVLLGTAALLIRGAVALMQPAVETLDKLAGGIERTMMAINAAMDSVSLPFTKINQIIDDLAGGIRRLFMVSGQLILAAINLSLGSIALLDATRTLGRATTLLVPSSMALYFSMFWLESAVNRLGRFSYQFAGIGASLGLLADSYLSLMAVDATILQDIAQAGLDAMPLLDQFATAIGQTAERLRVAVNQIRDPALELTAILQDLGDSLNVFDQGGVVIQTNVEDVIAQMDTYINSLQGSVARMEMALNAQAAPTMREAENAGMGEAMRGETISTVQVFHSAERAEDTDDLITQLALNNSYLEQIVAIISGSMEGESITVIRDMLAEYMPKISKAKLGMHNGLNQW